MRTHLKRTTIGEEVWHGKAEEIFEGISTRIYQNGDKGEPTDQASGRGFRDLYEWVEWWCRDQKWEGPKELRSQGIPWDEEVADLNQSWPE